MEANFDDFVDVFDAERTDLLVLLLENMIWPILVGTFVVFGVLLPRLFFSFNNVEFIVYSSAGLGVLTNGGTRSQSRKLDHHGVRDHFDAVVVSGEVGASKPDPDIFDAARDAIRADDYVFVADDLERDVLPAQRAGFTGVYLPDEDTPADAPDRADHVVESLTAVPDLLD